jgi:excisionase family DNA binding protein
MDDQQLLTPDQVADRLQLSVYTILDYLRHGHPRGGKLRGFKSGKQWRIREADLQAFIEANLSNGDRPSAPYPVMVPPVDTKITSQRVSEEDDAVSKKDTAVSVHAEPRKADLVARLRAMYAQGLSYQAIANQLNMEQVPTLRGTGRWQKGTVGNLLAQV